jgi:hypothetical protein
LPPTNRSDFRTIRLWMKLQTTNDFRLLRLLLLSTIATFATFDYCDFCYFRLLRLLRLSTIPERTATPASLPRDFCVDFETKFFRFFTRTPVRVYPPGGVAACPGGWCSRSGGGYTHGTRAAVAGVCGSDFYRVEVRSGSGRCLWFFLLYGENTPPCLCRFLLYGIKARRRGGWCSVFVEKTNK